MNKNIQILIAIIASMFLITTACNRDEAEEFPIADKDSFSINISLESYQQEHYQQKMVMKTEHLMKTK